jgi:hypothetical protein
MKYLILALVCVNVCAADNTITVDQVGDNNTIYISQDGTANVVTVNLGRTSAVDNTNINIVQQGTGAKTAGVDIPSGINNGVVLFQDGVGNHTASIQNLTGSGNNINISQTGVGKHEFNLTNPFNATNNGNTVDVTQSGGLGADKRFDLMFSGSNNAGVTVQQTNPNTADQGSMNIQCNPCGNGWSYIRN